MPISKNQKIRMLKDMMLIREFERIIKELYKQSLIEGAIHCYTGEEAIAVGICNALNRDDYIFSTHRGHGHAIAKGCDLNKIFAELMGKENGLCKGMGGSMHLFDMEYGLMGGNGIVGGGIPLSIGTAYASKYRGDKKVTVCFFSEGASNQGTFHESINMAALWNLPVVFVCENNLFAATTPSYKTLSNPDIAQRADSYSIPGVIADGNDVIDVYQKAMEAIERARKGLGPTLLECKTYRVEGHCMVLKDLPQHRPIHEVESWAKQDPVDVMEKKLLQNKSVARDIKNQLKLEIQNEISNAIEYAKASPLPNISEFEKVIKMRYQV